jgi:hypothetical protein
MSGHFFVVDGDLTKIACDAWLLPTDSSFSITDIWARAIGLRGAARLEEPRWSPGEYARRYRRITGSDVWLGKVGGQGTAGFVEAAQQFVRGAAAQCRRAADAEGRRPLLAINQLGSGKGGGKFRKGEGLPKVMDEVQTMLARDEVDVDVVLVTWGETAEAAAQWYRSTNRWHEAPEWRFAHRNDRLQSLAADLAAELRRNRASIFIGAGVSTGAGLPTWRELLEKIGASCKPPLTASDIARISDERDTAAILSERLERNGKSLGLALAKELRAKKYSLQHALLASLPCSEFITTNVDDLFEQACATAGRSVAVAPHIEPDAERWLLKLHGSVTEPRSMVFTRDSFLQMTRQSRALMGLVQAMLLTRHMIFVGYSLRDEDFHELMFEVRSAFPESRPKQKLGTVLTLVEDPLQAELWKDTVDVVAFHPQLPTGAGPEQRAKAIREAIPELQKFLDLVGLLAADKASFILDPTYSDMLTPSERKFANAIGSTLAQRPRGEDGPWTELEDHLRRFGLPHREA